MEEKPGRPAAITLLCGLFFSLSVLNFISIGYSLPHVPPAQAIWAAVSGLIAFASVIGLWRLRRWGVYLYLGGYLLGIASYYVIPPEGGPPAGNPLLLLVVPLIYCAIVLPHWKRLN